MIRLKDLDNYIETLTNRDGSKCYLVTRKNCVPVISLSRGLACRLFLRMPDYYRRRGGATNER